MEIEENELKEKCPNLYEELKKSPSVKIDEIKEEQTEGEEKEEIKDYSTNFPSIIDHLLGCETDEEALEIINYFEDEKKLDPQLAKKMREQIKEKGIRSFGEKRKKGSIEKNGLNY